MRPKSNPHAYVTILRFRIQHWKKKSKYPYCNEISSEGRTENKNKIDNIVEGSNFLKIKIKQRTKLDVIRSNRAHYYFYVCIMQE